MESGRRPSGAGPSSLGASSGVAAASHSEAGTTARDATNLAVLAARCRGLGVAMIPMDPAELAELARLAEGGITARPFGGASSAADSLPGTSPPQSAPPSLPDRDAAEEYAAWCAQAQAAFARRRGNVHGGGAGGGLPP